MKHKTLLKKLKANGWNMRFDAREQALIEDIAEITENESRNRLKRRKKDTGSKNLPGVLQKENQIFSEH